MPERADVCFDQIFILCAISMRTKRGKCKMSKNLIDRFCWYDFEKQKKAALTDTEKYQNLIEWALKAREINPNRFDALTEWLLNDSEWTEDKLGKNEQILMQGLLKRFKEQNIAFRKCLKNLEPPALINPAIYKALDRFDNELSGHPADKRIQEAVSQMFSDFSVMRKRDVRKLIAGNITGPSGTDTKDVDIFGYINDLKECDAAVQWALFMPSVAEQQQNGFKVETFEYKKMPAMRFIGKESYDGDGLDTLEGLKKLFCTLDTLNEYKSGFDFDVLFQHHYGKGVDVEHWHGFWGRFMKAGTPVPEGFLHFDFISQRDPHNFVSGPPYLSQFAFATFTGNSEALHKSEGYDSDAMYDITRNIMLGQGVNIPYPDKYWTAEVFLNGYDKSSSAYMFSAELL